MHPNPHTEKPRGTQAELKLLLEVDALSPPLAGIGRYVLALLQQFDDSTEFEDIQCFRRGRRLTPTAALRAANSRPADVTAHKSTDAKNPRKALKRWLIPPAKALLRPLLPALEKRALRDLAESHIYHAPNFRLAPFAGRKIVTFHDLSVLTLPEFHPRERVALLTPAMERAAQAADHIITPSAHVRREVMDHFGLPAGAVTAVPMASSLTPTGIDFADRNAYLGRLGLKPGHYYLFVATLEPRKNIAGLLAAHQRLPQSLKRHYPLVLVGQTGWQAQRFAGPLAAAKTCGDVLHLGHVPDQKLTYLYSGAAALTYPSFEEGFGLPLIEAQGFGVPVLSSKLSCMPEVTGGAALLIDPHSEQALAEGLQRIIEDCELRRELHRTGLQNALRFDWQRTARETIAVYRIVAQV